MKSFIIVTLRQILELSVGGRIVLKWIKETGWQDVDWTHLAHEMDTW
jgi:hypothetical protein